MIGVGVAVRKRIAQAPCEDQGISETLGAAESENPIGTCSADQKREGQRESQKRPILKYGGLSKVGVPVLAKLRKLEIAKNWKRSKSALRAKNARFGVYESKMDNMPTIMILSNGGVLHPGGRHDAQWHERRETETRGGRVKSSQIDAG